MRTHIMIFVFLPSYRSFPPCDLLRFCFHPFSTYVPSGDSKGLLDALLATSPKKSPTRSMSMKPESTKRGKSVKRSTKSNGGNGIVGDSTQETEKQTKSRKPASRKTTKAVDPNEKEVTQGADSTTTYGGFRCSLICR